MDAHVKDVLREMSKASDQERITFPEVVKALTEVGIERYHADLVAGRKTYYLPDGDFEDVEVHEVVARLESSRPKAWRGRSAPSSGGRSPIASSAARSRMRAASAILSALPGAARSIMAERGTSTWNGFPALSHNSAFASFAATRRKDPSHVRPHHAAHPAIRRYERLL